MASKTLSNHAHAAALIRAEMKRRNIIGKVRSSVYAGGCSVDIDVTDLPPTLAAELKAFADQFTCGHFDGMTDSYVYSNRRDDIPQVSYVFVNNRASAVMQATIRDFCAGYWARWNEMVTYEQERLAHQFFSREDSPFWARGAA